MELTSKEPLHRPTVQGLLSILQFTSSQNGNYSFYAPLGDSISLGYEPGASLLKNKSHQRLQCLILFEKYHIVPAVQPTRNSKATCSSNLCNLYMSRRMSARFVSPNITILRSNLGRCIVWYIHLNGDDDPEPHRPTHIYRIDVAYTIEPWDSIQASPANSACHGCSRSRIHRSPAASWLPGSALDSCFLTWWSSHCPWPYCW